MNITKKLADLLFSWEQSLQAQFLKQHEKNEGVLIKYRAYLQDVTPNIDREISKRDDDEKRGEDKKRETTVKLAKTLKAKIEEPEAFYPLAPKAIHLFYLCQNAQKPFLEVAYEQGYNCVAFFDQTHRAYVRDYLSSIIKIIQLCIQFRWIDLNVCEILIRDLLTDKQLKKGYFRSEEQQLTEVLREKILPSLYCDSIRNLLRHSALFRCSQEAGIETIIAEYACDPNVLPTDPTSPDTPPPASQPALSEYPANANQHHDTPMR